MRGALVSNRDTFQSILRQSILHHNEQQQVEHMAREFVGNSANFYLLPAIEGEGDKERRTYQPMAELILMTIEADYALDEKMRIVKGQDLNTVRMHISLKNLGVYIENLIAFRQAMEAFAIEDEQQRAGVDPGQMSLPGV